MTQPALRSSVESSSKASTAIPLEVAVFSASAALRAQALGAARVELNAPNSYALGGTTPPLSELSLLRDESSSSSSSALKIPVRIMIRPRGPPPSSSSSSSSPAAAQDFVYTADEFQRMKMSIRRFKASGLLLTASAHSPPPPSPPPSASPHSGDGFVFGILRAATGPGGNAVVVGIDEHRCRELVALASPYPCVFHRAFDQIASRENAQLLADLGFAGVLTAGGRGNCVDNKASVGRLLEATTSSNNSSSSSSSSSSGLEVIVGGGLRRDNIQVMAEQVRESSLLSTCGSGRAAALHTAALDNSSHHEEIDEDELSAMVAQLGSCV